MQEITEMTFEQAFEQLSETVDKLETGGLTLRESLELFEHGQALAARCGRLLDEAELRIQSMGSEGDEPFDLTQ